MKAECNKWGEIFEYKPRRYLRSYCDKYTEHALNNRCWCIFVATSCFISEKVIRKLRSNNSKREKLWRPALWQDVNPLRRNPPFMFFYLRASKR
jgi:hypothetical protein